MKTRILILAALAVMYSTSALAAERQKMFEKLDANHDGAVSLDEMKQAFPQADGSRFKKADTNGDGKLTREEWREFVQSVRASR
uniref:EF-hand domain-containing protein n=1 Tax=Fundidesulfovibrio putealis TaxID=270496 RepID=A0A7C4A859_9BACT